MEIRQSEERDTRNNVRERYLLFGIRQGKQEVMKVLESEWWYSHRNEKEVKVEFDPVRQVTVVRMALYHANYSGLADMLFKLACSESHGFRSDA